MKYKAMMNGKELVEHRMAGHEIVREMLNGRVIWEKNNEAIYKGKFDYTMNFAYPAGAVDPPGAQTKYMDEKVHFYGVKIEGNARIYIRTNEYGNVDYAYSACIKRNTDKTAYFNFVIAMDFMPSDGITANIFVSNSTRVNPQEEKKTLYINTLNIARVEPHIYAINGSYDPILLNEKDIYGVYLAARLPEIYSATPHLGGSHSDMQDAVAYVKSFL